MSKELKLSELKIGTTLIDKVCLVKDLSKTADDKGFLNCIIVDESGSLPAKINNALLIEEFKSGNTVALCGAYTKKGGENVVIITKVSKTETVIHISNTSDGLSEEILKKYVDTIRDVASRVKNEAYRALLEKAMTDDAFEKLSKLPATLVDGGKYPGGALQHTATVCMILGNAGATYARFGNGMYTRNFDWDAMLTAAVLQMYANTVYYQTLENGRVIKTADGLLAGYFTSLSWELQKLAEGTALTDNQSKYLLNILGASVRNGNNGIKPVSKEGALLKCINDTFNMLDIYDFEYARLSNKNIEGENLPYLYSERLDAYLIVDRKKEGCV